MAVLHGFEVLPILNEGDERISLTDILSLRDAYLTEREIWAVCRESCLAIQSLHHSSDAFQVLCISPESMAFDSNGNVCFLDLVSDPEVLYIPPEYETVGNSYKAHIYSLGMTLLFGAEYNSQEGTPRELPPKLSNMLSSMVPEEYDSRLELAEVMRLCDEALSGVTSLEICRDLASVAKLDVSDDRHNEILLEALSDDLGVVRSRSFKASPRQSPRPTLRSSPRASPAAELPSQVTGNPAGTQGDSERASTLEAVFSPDMAELVQHRTGGDVTERSRLPSDTPEQVEFRESRTRLNLWQVSAGDVTDTRPSFSPAADTQARGDSPGKLIPGLRTSDGTSGLRTRLKKHAADKDSAPVRTTPISPSAGTEPLDTEANVPLSNGDLNAQCDVTAQSDAARGADTRGGSCGSVRPAPYDEASTSFGYVSPRHAATVTVETIENHTPETGEHEASMDVGSEHEDGEGQTLVEILERLGLGLNENELWGLCRQCVAALLNCTGELPAYVCLETVCLLDTGEAVFRDVPDHHNMDVVYLAPELQESALVTEKSCLYGIAAVLWTAADYKMPENQEPALSEELENLLVTMTQDDPEARPRAADVLLVCNDYERRHPDSRSRSTCQALAMDARKAAEYGKDNVLVHQLINEDIEQKTEDSHVSVMDAIKNNDLQSQLKPVSERQLADKPIRMSQYDLLMEEIRAGRKLRKSSKPRLLPVREIFVNSPELMQNLLRVTGKLPGCDVIPPHAHPGTGRRLPKTPPLQHDVIPNAYHSDMSHFKPIDKVTAGEKEGRPARTLRDLKNMKRSRGSASQREDSVGEVTVEVERGSMSSQGHHKVMSPAHSDGKDSNDNEVFKMEDLQGALPGMAQPLTPNMYGSMPNLLGLDDAKRAQYAQSLQYSQPQYPFMAGYPPVMNYPGMMTPSGGMMMGGAGGMVAPPGGVMAPPGGMFPPAMLMQVQDPRTGMIQLIPVAMPHMQMPPAGPISPGQMQQQQQHPKEFLTQQSQPNARLHSESEPALEQGQLLTQRSLSRDAGEEARRAKRARDAHTHRPQKPPRTKSDADSTDSAPAAPPAAHAQSEQTDAEEQARAAAKAKFKREREMYRARAQQEARGEAAALVQQAATKRRQETAPALRKFNSEEGLDKVAQPDRVHVREARKGRIKRAKSGSSVDYDAGQLAVHTEEIHIDHVDDRTHAQARVSEEDHQRSADRRSPDRSPGAADPPTPLSSPISKDSGVGDMNHKPGDASLMERLLNAETLRHQERLAAVIRLLREEFTYDGFMDTGNADTTMAEYILSLARLQWNTFQSAVTEKFKDVYWNEELLASLYDSINEKSERLVGHEGTARVISVDEPRPVIRGKDSAFRPIGLQQNGSVPHDGLLVRPRAVKVVSDLEEDVSDLEDDPEDYDDRGQEITIDRMKSSSMHDLVPAQLSLAPLTRAHSQGALHQLEDEEPPSEGGTGAASNYIYRYDSDSSSASERRTAQRAQANAHARDSAPRIVMERTHTTPRGDAQLPSLHPATEFDTDSVTSDKKPDDVTGGALRLQRGSIVYYHAEMGGQLRPDIREFAAQVDTRTRESIESKIQELDQQMMMEHKQRKKTVRYYGKIQETARQGKLTADLRTQATKIARQLGETNDRLDFLNQAKKHLEMLFAEQWGLDHSLLYALSKCPGNEPMLLAPCDNPGLQYQAVKQDAGQEGLAMQAGQPAALMAYLFAQNALSEGFIHCFFYCYRYMLTADTLLSFLMNKFSAACLSLCPDHSIPQKVKARAVDLFQVWIEGYFAVDFKNNSALLDRLKAFLRNKVLSVDSSAEYLLELVDDCLEGRHDDLSYPEFTSLMWEFPELQLLRDEHAPPKKWESFKAALHLSARPQRISSKQSPLKGSIGGATDTRPPAEMDADAAPYVARPSGGLRTDSFSLSDFTAVGLAEQLTLMEADLFALTHPVHFLNSKAQGVGVALTQPVIRAAQSLNRIVGQAWEGEPDVASLFVGPVYTDDVIQRLLEHAQSVTLWVAAEILSCSSVKGQVTVIAKFITAARLCQEFRNYATAVSIAEGLCNVVIRQLPAWKHLPAKYSAQMQELTNLSIFLKSDAHCLTGAQPAGTRGYPTIPCVLVFLLHVQQLEIGGFTLANGMYKWNKMRAIAKVIDQIRQFKTHSYTFSADYDCQISIRQRMQEFGQQDLHSLAAQQSDTNFQKISSSKLQGALRRMRNKLQVKSSVDV